MRTVRVRNVLVFPAGTEIGQEICGALKAAKEIRLFGAGEDISNHEWFTYPEYHVLPNVHENGWIERLSELCRDHGIDCIIPAHDDVVLALARAARFLPATVISSALETCEIARSKSATYRFLSDVIRVPRIYRDPSAVGFFPVLVKPDRGQGSMDIRKVENVEELAAAMASTCNPIICEFLPGEEYTIDCFSDREKGLLFAGARLRNRTRNGISVNTVTVELPAAWDMATRISEKLSFRGAWFFQVKRAGDGELSLLEVAPRIAGSMAAHRVLGINFPLLSIFEHERLPVRIAVNPGPVELDRSLANRYRHSISFSALYVDFDDTLLQRGSVDTEVVTLIYQCINRGIPVKLLTRHASDISHVLMQRRLAGLFDAVIHLRKGEPKSAEIKESDAILLDDSFSERMEVASKLGIRTFDCSMIEVLTMQPERHRLRERPTVLEGRP
jgi:carbamoylphosphate synthase large subunit